MNARMHSDKLLFDCSVSRDASRMYSSGNLTERNVSTPYECVGSRYPNTNMKPSGMPVKLLIAQEMSKEVDSGGNQPNLVAKLMGLDALPSTEPRDQEQRNRYPVDIGRNVNETWRSGKLGVSENGKRMELVRQKFSEAKRMSLDGNLRGSKQFQEALHVLSCNNDLFLKCLQEPDSIPSEQHGDWRPLPPPDTRRITVLFPSRISDDRKFVVPANKTGNRAPKDAAFSRIGSEKISTGGHCSPCLENPTQPTRIVVLKPSFEKVNDPIPLGSPHIDPSKQWHDNVLFGNVLEESRNQERREDAGVTDIGTRCRDETEDTSFFPQRRSWDCVDKFGSPCSSRSHSQRSYSPDSSVFREAKKRLSVRLATMTSSDEICQEERPPLRSSTKSLGEMLALSEAKSAAVCGEDDSYYPGIEDPKEHLAHQTESEDIVPEFPRNLIRSKSVPVTSPDFRLKLDSDMSVMRNKVMQQLYQEEAKEKTGKSSFKGLLSSLLSLKNKRSGTEKACTSESNDETLPFPEEQHCRTNGSCILELPYQAMSTKQGSSTESSFSLRDGESTLLSHEPNSYGGCGDSRNQPSLVSMMDPLFGDECIGRDLPQFLKPNQRGSKLLINSRGSNLLGKSPAIGSVPRTISWDELYRDTAPSHPAAEFSRTRKSNEEPDWSLFAKTLLSVSCLQDAVLSNRYPERWHSPETPLDPLIRDKYIDIQDKEMVHDAKRSRSTRYLVYDCVNEALLQIAGPWLDLSHCSSKRVENVESTLGDKVLALLNSLFSREARRMSDGCETDDSISVEVVVKDEVVSQGWTEQDHFGVEINDVNNEITGTLLDNLVHEAVIEMMAL